MTSTNLLARPVPVIDGRLQDFSADPVTCMRRLQSACGNLVALREDDQQLIFAFGPEYNRHLLSQTDLFHSRFFAIRGPRASAQRRLTAGLLSMNGDEHAQQRRIVKGAFEKRVIPGYAFMVRELAAGMLRDWEPGQSRDICEDMTRLMLKITGSMLFGLTRLETAAETSSMMEQWIQLNHELGTAAFITRDEFYPRYQHLLAFAETLEERIVDMIRTCEASGADGNDVLSLMIRARQNGADISDEQLIGQAALLFAAAHMTTAHTLTWTLTLLSQHPVILKQLMQELNSAPPFVAGEPDSANATVQSGNFSSTLLERVIRESMRILPASSYSQRVAKAASVLGRSHIPSGAVIIFSQFMTHRIESIYPQANVFDPDRWLTARPGPYEYLPFGGGSRLCLGAPLALSILHTVLPMILRKVSLQLEPWSEITGLVRSTMLAPVTGIRMQLLQPGTEPACGPVRGNIHSLVRLPEQPGSKLRAA